MSNGTESVATEQKVIKPSGWIHRLQKIVVQVASIILLAICIGWVLNRIAATLERTARPAGFVRGMVQGALMPMSMPNLLAGRDITIYSANNTGVPYKLGYTAGTNTCGAIFFGIFFWRVRRWRATARRDNGTKSR